MLVRVDDGSRYKFSSIFACIRLQPSSSRCNYTTCISSYCLWQRAADKFDASRSLSPSNRYCVIAALFLRFSCSLTDFLYALVWQPLKLSSVQRISVDRGRGSGTSNCAPIPMKSSSMDWTFDSFYLSLLQLRRGWQQPRRQSLFYDPSQPSTQVAPCRWNQAQRSWYRGQIHHQLPSPPDRRVATEQWRPLAAWNHGEWRGVSSSDRPTSTSPWRTPSSQLSHT